MDALGGSLKKHSRILVRDQLAAVNSCTFGQVIKFS